MRWAGKFAVGLAAAAVLAVGTSLPSRATQICSDLSDCTYKIDHYTGKDGRPKGAPWGKITLTQVDGGVEISIVLKGKTSFAENRGGDAFMFNLTPKITPASIVSVSTGFAFDSRVGKTSAGLWQYGMVCRTCGNDPSKVRKLDFVITGITLADFVANNKNFSFGADLCFHASQSRGSCSRIGDAVARYFDKIDPAPEPVTFSLFAVALGAMGALRFRRRGQAVTPVA